VVCNWLVAVQLALVIPVVVWLGQQTRRIGRGGGRSSHRQRQPLAVVLQLLLVTGVLPFERSFHGSLTAVTGNSPQTVRFFPGDSQWVSLLAARFLPAGPCCCLEETTNRQIGDRH
jgi:hypothetical protein